MMYRRIFYVSMMCLCFTFMGISFLSAGEAPEEKPEHIKKQKPADTGIVEEDLADLSRKELSVRLKDVKKQMKQTSRHSSDLKQELSHMSREARKKNKDVLKVREEIKLLKEKIGEIVNELPEIKERTKAVKDSHDMLRELARKRQRILKLIASAGAMEGAMAETEGTSGDR